MGAEMVDLLTGDKLRKASLQDEIVSTIFDSVNDAVFHGGTAIWRCYDGKRFSKDIDIYVNKGKSIEKILANLTLKGDKIKKDKQRKEKLFYSVIGHGTDVSLQFKKKRATGIVVPYRNIDGTLISVYSLAPEALILEKIETYVDRLDERDIYDMMVLTNSASKKTLVSDKLARFLNNIKEPKNKNSIKDLVYAGVSPSFDQMVEYLKDWCMR